MQTGPFRLTFGVELEFIVSYNPEEYRAKTPAERENVCPGQPLEKHTYDYEMLVRQCMVQTLQENGFFTHGYSNTDVSKWNVTTDDTISVEGRKNCCAIELKSPALVYSPEALEQVTRVVQLVVSRFNPFVNKTCGLHVHVGNETRGFTMDTLKNFASLITVFEKQLNSLHPPDRLENEFARPVCSAFRKDAPPTEKLLIIDQLKTLDEFVCRFHPIEEVDEAVCRDDTSDRYMAFNFFNLQEGEPFKTIEFRQHQATLDPTQIANWVSVACNLVCVSHADGEGVCNLIQKQMNNEKYTVIDLFEDLKLPDLAEFYAPRIEYRQKIL